MAKPVVAGPPSAQCAAQLRKGHTSTIVPDPYLGVARGASPARQRDPDARLVRALVRRLPQEVVERVVDEFGDALPGVELDVAEDAQKPGVRGTSIVSTPARSSSSVVMLIIVPATLASPFRGPSGLVWKSWPTPRQRARAAPDRQRRAWHPVFAWLHTGGQVPSRPECELLHARADADNRRYDTSRCAVGIFGALLALVRVAGTAHPPSLKGPGLYDAAPAAKGGFSSKRIRRVRH